MIEYVIKRDGRKEAFDPEKLNSWGIWASKTIDPKVVNWSSVVLRTVSTLPKQVTTDELQKALIKSCIDMDTYEHNRMAGRLYADALPKQLYKDRKYPHIRDLHKEMSKKGLIRKDINYTDEEYDRINKMIKHKRDIGYTYYSSHHIMSKYAKKDHTTKKTYETPQFVYMRVAMQTFLNYQGEDRMEKLENLYTKLSTRKINIPTPYFANSLTSNPNVASCSVLTTKDEAQSIGIGSLLAYSLTTSGAGLGLHLKTRSLGDAVRGGDIEHSGKVPYYRAYAHSIKSSKQGCYDTETEVLTEKGWKYFKDLTEEDLIVQVHDDLSVEAVKPTRIIEYRHTGKMYKFGMSRTLNILVTPDHRMVYKQTKKVISDTATQRHLDLGWSQLTNTQWISPEFSEVHAEEANLSRLTCLFNSANTSAVSEEFSPLDALKVAYQADGFSAQYGGRITFHISKTRKQFRLEGLLEALSLTYEKTTHNGGVSYVYRVNKGPHEFVKDFSWVLPLTRSSAWLKAFLEELEHWDGSHLDTEQNAFLYTSTNEECIDVAQMAATLCGAYSCKKNIGRKKDHHQDRFTLTVSFFKSHICSSKIVKEEVDYDDMVYCVEVPSNKIIVRRKGLTLVCGNSRGGAGTMYFPFFDPEVITLLNLKNPLSVDSKRLRELDYALLVNKWFVRKAIKKEPVWLFSYKDNPELYELFYDKDPDAFGVAMEEFAQKHKKKVTEVNASEILAACLRQSVETGRVYMMFADEANRRSPYKEKIYSSNLCISGDQLVVSDKGLLTAEELYTLEGDSLVLFDGKEPVQSSSMKLRGISEDVYKITLKNGMTHTVTDYHKVMTNKGLVQCKHLVPGEHKAKINISEGIFGTNDMVDEAYLLGLWQGDGTSSGQEIHIDVWEDKTAHLRDIILETYLRVRDKYTGGIYEVKNQTGVVVGTRKYSQPVFTLSSKIGSKDKWRLSSRVLKKYLDFKKNEIPLWVRQGTKQTQVAYIKGLFQTDGTYTYSSNAHYLSISQTDRKFLESLQILLNNLGYIFSLSVGRKAGNYLLPDSNRGLKEYSCKEIYRLVSGNFYTCLKFEKDTGFMSFRGKTLPEPIKQVYAPKEFIDIVSVEYVGKEDVYCPTVNSDEHLFVGNCFITRNCTEILLPTKPYGSIEDLSSSDVDKGTVAFCNLAGIVVDNIEDDTDYEDSCYYALLMIDEGINNALLPYESLNHSIRYYRSAGVGILGLAHLMAKNKLSYKSREGLTFIHNLAEKHAYYLYKSALRLGKERGNAECMDRTLFPDGWLPIDVMNPNLGDLCDTELKYDWETLRQEIVANGGIRFSTVSTIPPSENCLAFDTKVKTDKGDMTLKEIFDGYVDTSLDEAMRDYSPLTGGKWYELNQPLKALTASGEYHTIPRIWLNGIVKPFKITLEDGTVVKATESHKFLVERDRPTWVPAYDLKVGDNIINIAEE